MKFKVERDVSQHSLKIHAEHTLCGCWVVLWDSEAFSWSTQISAEGMEAIKGFVSRVKLSFGCELCHPTFAVLLHFFEISFSSL